MDDSLLQTSPCAFERKRHYEEVKKARGLR